MKCFKPFISLGMAAAVLLLFPGLPKRAFAVEKTWSTPVSEQYRRALEVDPENPVIRYCRGVALLHEDRTEEAVSELRRVYSFFSDSIEMNYNLGIGLTGSGDAVSARLYLEQAEALGALRRPQIYPLSSAYYNIGLVYLENGQVLDALPLFRKVLELAPGRTDIYRLLGEIYRLESGNDKAVQAFRAYLRHYPADDEVREQLFAIHFDRALDDLEQDRLDAARLGFEKALEISPASPLASYHLGSIAYQQGKWTETVRKLAPYYADYPDDLLRAARPLLLNSSIALQQGGHSDQAGEALKALVRRHPENIRILYLAGNIHLDLREFPQAQKYYEQILELEPGHNGAEINLGAARRGAVEELVSQGQNSVRREEYTEAAQSFRRALVLDPNDPIARNCFEGIEPEIEKAFRKHLGYAEDALNEELFREAMLGATRAGELRPEAADARRLAAKIRSSIRQASERRLRKARNALDRGELVAAEKGFTAILSLDPQDPDLLRDLKAVKAARSKRASSLAAEGRAFLAEGQLEKAKKAFDSSLALQSDHPKALSGQYQLEALISSMFDEKVKWARRAMNKGRFDVAESYYSKALELKDDATVRSEKADVAHRKHRRLEGLLASAREALAAGDCWRARNLVGKALEMAPENAAARELSSVVSETAVREVKGFLISAAAAAKAGEPGRALSYYRKVLELEPTNALALDGVKSGRAAMATELDLLASRASDALAEGHLDKAKTLVRRALDMDPHSESVLNVSRRIATFGEKVRETDPANDRVHRNSEKTPPGHEQVSERQNG